MLILGIGRSISYNNIKYNIIKTLKNKNKKGYKIRCIFVSFFLSFTAYL